jgi:hypothetical protein
MYMIETKIMSRILTACLLLLTSVAMHAATVDLGGSATQTCHYVGLPPAPPGQSDITQTAAGPDIHLTCSDPYLGPSLDGTIGPLAGTGLSTNVTMTGGASTGWVVADFQASLTDTLLALGGSGSGAVEFTLDYDWHACQDGSHTDIASDFFFGGASAWSDAGSRGHHCPFPFDHPSTIVLDEPITYGQPFTWRESISLDAANGDPSYSAGISLAVSAVLLSGGTLISVPEPASVCMFGGALLLAAASLMWRGPRRE